jgi:hypothetical protein
MHLADELLMKNLILSSFLLISLTGCTNISRYVASSHGRPPELNDLLRASEQILADVEDYHFPEKCVTYLKELEIKIDKLDVKKLPLKDIKDNAETITKNSWETRSKLHQRLSEFSKECVLQVQANLRQFRFIEDYMLEISRRVKHGSPSDIDFQKQPVPMLETVPFYETRLNDKLKFEPGDLLITRGVSFLSGMIARLGKRATQFSHVVMVVEDPETKKLKTVESYVGVGVAFYDLDFALKNENARILWLRAKDRKLGRKAALQMSTLVKARLDAKNPIKYDYELNFNDQKTMSCAEVSQVAFEMASNKQFHIPYYKNELDGENDIVKRLNLLPGETYEPGDMEIDPRFDLIGEFQDLRLTRDSRQKDAIMTAIFSLMDDKNYALVDSSKSKMAGGPIYTIRRTFAWPLVKRILKIDDFSKEIPRTMLKTVTLINQLGESLLEDVKKHDLEHEKKYGISMSYMDFYQLLEKMRVDDLKLYQNPKTRKQAKFHQFLRPKELNNKK